MTSRPRPILAFLPLFCILVLSVPSIPARAQNYDQLISREISRLRTEKIDTVLWLSLPDYRFSHHWEPTENLGNVFVFSASYLFYARNHRLVARKFYDYEDSSSAHIRSCAASQEKILDNDSLFRWAEAHWDTLRSDDIHPYIYPVKRGDSTYYQLLQEDRPARYSFGFYTPADSSYNSLTASDLELHAARPPLPANLNYSPNIHTKLFLLFTRLKKYDDRLGRSFIF